MISVTGNVVDATGEPLPGVTVVIEGTSKGTVTDIDGNYVLKVSLNDTLVFSFTGMKTQKIKVDKQEVQVKLFEIDPIHESFDPAYYTPRIKKLEATTVVSKKDIENASNPKYQFKKNANNNVFVIYVSELTFYDFNKEDIEFQQKSNVKYSLIGSYQNDYLKKYNKLTFKHLKKKYKKSWLTEIRKDAIGLDNFK